MRLESASKANVTSQAKEDKPARSSPEPGNASRVALNAFNLNDLQYLEYVLADGSQQDS